MMRWWLLLACGCNQLFSLAPTKNPLDAPPDVDYCAVHQGSAVSHDEDSDLVDDGCDSCPGIANPDQADTLELANGGVADGVGDACDPSPTVGGDRLVKFAPFASTSELAAWSVASGTWSVTADTLAYVDPSSQGTGQIAYSGAAVPARFAVEARLVIDAVPPAGITGTVAITLVDSTSGSFACELDHDAMGDLIYLYTAGGTGGSDTALLTTPVAAGTAYQLRVVWTGANLSCLFDDGNGQHVVAHTGDGGIAMATLRFTVEHFSAHFDYVAIYDLSGEP